MDGISDKLKEMLGKKGLMTGAEWRARQETGEKPRPSVDYSLESLIPGEVIGDAEDGFYLVRQDLPLDTVQGHLELGAGLEAMPQHIALSACDAELAGFNPATAVFVDTETTGLSGGAGTTVFLFGAAYFVDGALRLEQCFMRDFDDEAPMLRYLDQLLRPFETIVSYNGKSFDLPLLRTRFISNRIPFRPGSLPHFDLVHAARRFWKKRVRDCSLSSIERTILGVHRHGDIPSALIPEIWFEYLRTRDARRLERVFYHHRMDILSLVVLTAWLSRCLAVPDGHGFEHAEDRLSLLRLHFRLKRYEEVVSHAKALMDLETEMVLRRECLELLALAQKRLGDWEQMEWAWTRMLQEFPSDFLPRLELAKHYEHRARNLIDAERVCREAIELLETRRTLGRTADLELWHAQTFRHRLERIQRKLAKALPPQTEID